MSILVSLIRYTEDMELDDAIHTAILTLKEGWDVLPKTQFSLVLSVFYNPNISLYHSFEGEISSKNIEIGEIGADKVFR